MEAKKHKTLEETFAELDDDTLYPPEVRSGNEPTAASPNERVGLDPRVMANITRAVEAFSLRTMDHKEARIERIHQDDIGAGPEHVATAKDVLGRIGVHYEMFKYDKYGDGHKRTPAEVKQLIGNLIGKNGVMATLDMFEKWKGFSLKGLPADIKRDFEVLFHLAPGFLDGAKRGGQ